MKLELSELYEKVANQTGLPKGKVEMAFRSMFEMVADTMREQKGDNILLPKFGKFVVPLMKLKYLNHEKYVREADRNKGRMGKFINKESKGRSNSSEEARDLPSL
jgi:hypothetical protein